MNSKEISKRIAKKLGCKPKWYAPYNNYTCTCENLNHAVDSQCSSLMDYSEHKKAYGLG